MSATAIPVRSGPAPGLPQLLAPLNRLITPALRCGLASPLPFASGLVLLEVAGRKTGRPRTVPLVCMDYGATLVVATVREESQWLKNLTATPAAHVWLRGSRRPVSATIYQKGERVSAEPEPRRLESALARTVSRVTGASVALLVLANRIGPDS